MCGDNRGRTGWQQWWHRIECLLRHVASAEIKIIVSGVLSSIKLSAMRMRKRRNGDGMLGLIVCQSINISSDARNYRGARARAAVARHVVIIEMLVLLAQCCAVGWLENIA
jgi:hypothetical protein